MIHIENKKNTTDVNPSILVIALKVNGLNASIKKVQVVDWIKI